MTEQLGFSEVSNEIVDNNQTEEKELVDQINASLTGLECGNLAIDKLESMNKNQLAAFLTKNYFDGGIKSYAECKNSGEILNFSMKAALQFLAETDTRKYNSNGIETTNQNGKTAMELLKTRGGIDLNNDNALIKVLQNIVGAYPDGKPGPQTIALVISALGGDISGIYEGVNNLYDKNERLRVQNIAEFEIGGKTYKYDKNQITIGQGDNKIIITYESQIKEVDATKNPPVCEGFTFENGWIKRGKASKNTPNPGKSPENGNKSTPNNNAKNDETPGVPKDWDKNIDVGDQCTEATSNFIHNNNHKLAFTEKNKMDYLKILDDILGDTKKAPTFYSFIKLNKKFRGNYRLTYEDLTNFYEKAGKGTGRCFDATGSSAVFHEASGMGNGNIHDYCTWNGTYLIKHNESSKNSVFEVDGSGNKDDYRFDSVEAFCKYISGAEIKRARGNVRNLAKEKQDISYWSEKIKPDVMDKKASLRDIGFGDESKRGLEKRKTFISLLELPDHFWKGYKLSVKDINNFARGMKENIFDSKNATVFHTEGGGKRGINKNVPMFEVDGSASGNHRSDRRFTSVENFFHRLSIRIEKGSWPK